MLAETSGLPSFEHTRVHAPRVDHHLDRRLHAVAIKTPARNPWPPPQGLRPSRESKDDRRAWRDPSPNKDTRPSSMSGCSSKPTPSGNSRHTRRKDSLPRPRGSRLRAEDAEVRRPAVSGSRSSTLLSTKQALSGVEERAVRLWGGLVRVCRAGAQAPTASSR